LATSASDWPFASFWKSCGTVSQVVGRAREVVVRSERRAVPEIAEAVRAAEEERRAALLDLRLHRVRLVLRDPARLQVGVDLVDRRRLGRVLELLRRDPEMPRDSCQEAVAVRRRALRGRNRPASSDDEREGRRGDECSFRVQVLHLAPSFLPGKQLRLNAT